MPEVTGKMLPLSLKGKCVKSQRFDSAQHGRQFPGVDSADGPVWVAFFDIVATSCRLPGVPVHRNVGWLGWLELVVDFQPAIGKMYPLTVYVFRDAVRDRPSGRKGKDKPERGKHEEPSQ